MVFCWTFHHQIGQRYSEYLSQGDNVIGIWIGKSSTLEKFGVTAGTIVRHDDFSKLEAGKHVLTGKWLSQRHNTTRKDHRFMDGKFVEVEVSNRRSLYDFSVSLPKSMSVALLVGGRSDILAMHNKAVDRVVEEMERMTTCAKTRGNIRTKEVTGEFCAARFLHFTNRSDTPDPSVHTHISVIPVTPTANGNYAIDATDWINQCSRLTAIYRDVLASEALKSGLELEIDRFGAPQIKQISDLNKKFSGRADDIEAMCECCESIVGSKLTDSERKRLVLQCRGIDIPGFHEIWEREREKLTIQYIDDPHALKARKRFLAAFEAIVRSCSDQSPQEPKEVESLVDGWKTRLDPEELKRLMNLETSAAPPRRVTVQEAVAWSLKHSFEREAVKKMWQLETEALKYAQGANLNLEELRKEIQEHPNLIFRGTECTTTAHYARECACMEWIEKSHNQGASLKRIKSDHLTKHQLKAVNELLASPERFTCLIGRSGTGKTESVNALIEANISMGYSVIALAPSVRSRDVIKHLERHTLQRFLIDKKEQSQIRSKDLIVLDEAGFASFEQMFSLMKLAVQNDWRVLFSGDPRQNVSVEASGGMRVMLDRTKLKREWLSDILRQKPDAMNGYYLMAARLFSQQKPTEAFAKLDRAGAIYEAQGQARIDAMADMYIEEIEAGRSCLCVQPSHEENDALNETIRERLKEKGQLGEEKEITVHRTLGWTKAQRENVRDLRPGLVLEITLGKDKGDVFEVRSVDKVKNVVYAVNSRGIRARFDKKNAEAFAVCERRTIKVSIGDKLVTHSSMKTKKGEVMNGYSFTVKEFTPSGDIISESGKVIKTKNLAVNYSSTSHRSQGESCDTVLVGFSRKSLAWANQKIAYVAATRGRYLVRIFCEQKLDLLQIEKKTGDKKSSLELIKFVLDIARFKKSHQVQHQINRAA